MRVQVDSFANGGAGVARADDGRVVFVEGALPGEEVDVAITRDRGRFLEAAVTTVRIASDQRVTPPCPHVDDGCGGCDFQHATADLQREAKVVMVRDALERIGRLTDPVVHRATPLPDRGYRTTVRCVVDRGRAGFRRRSSHEPIPVDECLVTDPALTALITEGRFGAATEITLRMSRAGGERLVVVTPAADDGIVVPDDVFVIGADDLAAGADAAIHETVAGRRWRVSAASFFQARPDGAEELVRLVRAAAGDDIDTLVDLYAGVGLFAGTVAATRVVAVESNRAAVADAVVNLADLDAEVIRCRVERWRPTPADVVVADPSRSGLAAAGVDRVVATGADTVVLVSCDAGSLGRDAGLLRRAGYRHEGSTLVDLFPHTSHVEVVSRFARNR